MQTPIAHRLVPSAPEPLAPDFVRLTEPLTAGLPQTIPLDRELSLVLTLPNGLARTWKEADPAQTVSSSAAELGPAPDSPPPGGDPIEAPLRLLVLVTGEVVASVPLVAGLRRAVPDGGGSLAELVVLGWDVRAGSLRAPGDAVSRIDLAWRRVDRPSGTFEPPPLHPGVAARLARADRLESEPVREIAGDATAHRRLQVL